jgi:hypothetical protein
MRSFSHILLILSVFVGASRAFAMGAKLVSPADYRDVAGVYKKVDEGSGARCPERTTLVPFFQGGQLRELDVANHSINRINLKSYGAGCSFTRGGKVHYKFRNALLVYVNQEELSVGVYEQEDRYLLEVDYHRKDFIGPIGVDNGSYRCVFERAK